MRTLESLRNTCIDNNKIVSMVYVEQNGNIQPDLSKTHDMFKTSGDAPVSKGYYQLNGSYRILWNDDVSWQPYAISGRLVITYNLNGGSVWRSLGPLVMESGQMPDISGDPYYTQWTGNMTIFLSDDVTHFKVKFIQDSFGGAYSMVNDVYTTLRAEGLINLPTFYTDENSSPFCECTMTKIF